jgi:hypothetical protein
MTFARGVFTLAGIVGVLAVPPLYLLEARLGGRFPPPITHPELYYGFVGVVVAWQLVYLMIGRDPVRHRPMMPLAALAKLSFGVALLVLFVQGRVAGTIVATGLPDLVFAVLFLAAYRQTPSR